MLVVIRLASGERLEQTRNGKECISEKNKQTFLVSPLYLFSRPSTLPPTLFSFIFS